jgi:NADH:ubiquinone oxidoreductase subunit 6 (subunit J)
MGLQGSLQLIFAVSATGFDSATTFIILLFLPVGILFLLLGVYLWNWERIRVLIGIVLTVVGGFFAIVTFTFAFASKNNLMKQGGPIASITIMLILLFFGILLIIQQKRIDNKDHRLIIPKNL